MTQSIDACLSYVRSTVGAIDGIRAAPDGLIDAAQVWPLFVCWPGPSRIYRESADTVRCLWSITGQVHFTRRDLRTAAEQAQPFYALIARALTNDPTLGASCSTIGELTFTGLQAMTWGDVQSIGFAFTIADIKIREDWAAT